MLLSWSCSGTKPQRRSMGYELLFYGDSITETWRGTDMGRQCSRCQGVPEVFDEYFGSKYKAEVLAVGGDQAAHLMWRLQHGQLYMHSQPRLIVVMIGTNDLGAASCLGGASGIKKSAKGAAERTLGVLRFLREKNPDAHIIALAVLPRGWTDAWHVYDWPSMYKGGIDVINRALKDFAAQDDAVTYLDCSPALLPDGKIHPELMPDALHPNADGMELFAKCLSPVVDELMEEEQSGLWRSHRIRDQERYQYSTVNWCQFPEVAEEPVQRLEPLVHAYFANLAAEVASADQGQGADVVFYGDSITESWRGTALGAPCARCAGIPDVFGRYFSSKYTTKVLGIACDQTSHLMWRLQNGNLFVRNQPRVIVVLIGTNDLTGAAYADGDLLSSTGAAQGIASRFHAGSELSMDGMSFLCLPTRTTAATRRVLDLLSFLGDNNPESQVILMGLLPRGWDTDSRRAVWPNPYTMSISFVNAALAQMSSQDSRVHFLNCTSLLLSGGQMHPDLMPDGLHPSAAGMELIARSLSPLIDRLMAD
ncbi:probable platelet-activating factor acetylhydrolase IB subunit gamma at N-terminal half [Coccomyxa sp. Obi]|nr:probable platelet-activating factor acetylhydrolase IB subunit gamma at N-terminal half [Coccomyxa sp. Obi]